MPRAARIDIPDLLQHVIVRGIEKRDIFLDDSDRASFVQRLGFLLLQTGRDTVPGVVFDVKPRFMLSSTAVP
jgi:putative transposase